MEANREGTLGVALISTEPVASSWVVMLCLKLMMRMKNQSALKSIVISRGRVADLQSSVVEMINQGYLMRHQILSKPIVVSLT